MKTQTDPFPQVPSQTHRSIHGHVGIDQRNGGNTHKFAKTRPFFSRGAGPAARVL